MSQHSQIEDVFSKFHAHGIEGLAQRKLARMFHLQFNFSSCARRTSCHSTENSKIAGGRYHVLAPRFESYPVTAVHETAAR